MRCTLSVLFTLASGLPIIRKSQQPVGLCKESRRIPVSSAVRTIHFTTLIIAVTACFALAACSSAEQPAANQEVGEPALAVPSNLLSALPALPVDKDSSGLEQYSVSGVEALQVTPNTVQDGSVLELHAGNGS